MRLKIIQICPIPMFRRVNAMSGAMDEIATITSASDERTHNVIDLPPLNTFTSLQAFACKCYASIARTTHKLEDATLLCRNLCLRAHKSHPGVIGENGVWLRQVCPEIEEYQITALYRTMACCSRYIMRIAGIPIDSY